SIVVGSMVGSVIAMMSSVGNHVAHGGPIVAVLGAVDNVLMFFVAAIIGTIVTAFMVNFLKKDVHSEDIQMGEEETEKETKDEPVDNKNTPKEIHKLTDIMDGTLIKTDLSGESRDEIIEELIEKLDAANALDSKQVYKEAILAREAEGTTGLGMGIAIPHGKSKTVKKPAVAFGIK